MNQKDSKQIVRRTVSEQNSNTAEIVASYKSVFNGIGTFKNHTVTFHINKKVQPVTAPIRPVPFHLRERFKQEIRQMEIDGIIEEHHGPAPSVSKVVLAPKDNGSMRVTVDMREANRSILDTHVPIPRPDDVKASLSGCQYFSKLDFNSAFHQLQINPASRYITDFHSNDRLMRYKRLTMGTKPAS